MKLRIGAVAYLNTKPLICDWSEQVPEHDLHLDYPSRLAEQLNRGTLDVALIPSVEFLRSQDWSIVSDACIACRGPVRSVQILFRRPPHAVRSLAIDEGSRTSVALAQVLLAKQVGVRPSLHKLALTEDFRTNRCDAAVVIGDRAMHVPKQDYEATWDLGEEWHKLTGLPFVFAMWVARHAAMPGELSGQLEACRNSGLQRLSRLAEEFAPQHQLTTDDCLTYFSQQLQFHLRAEELAGLDLFRRYSMELGLLPATCTQLSLMPL